MTKERLIELYGYWGEHPDLPYRKWVQDVNEDSTRMGYWEWVEAQLNEE
jgi:hypothetical protein